MPKGLIILIGIMLPYHLWAQTPKDMLIAPANSVVKDTTGQHDLIGILLKLTHIHIKKPPTVEGKRVYYSLLPLSTAVPRGRNAILTSPHAAVFFGNRRTTFTATAPLSPVST